MSQSRSTWQALLSSEESFVAPWYGQAEINNADRRWRLKQRPAAHGWFRFVVSGANVVSFQETAAVPEMLQKVCCGYLVGNRFVDDTLATKVQSIADVVAASKIVHLIEEGLDRFVRVSVGLAYPRRNSELVYRQQEMPIGPEMDVLNAFINRIDIDSIKGVSPALEAAFFVEMWHRTETERRRAEIERQRQEEEERIRQEERRRELLQSTGSSVGRRHIATFDFETAARAALSLTNGKYIDHRLVPSRHEAIVRYSVDEMILECVCDSRTLQILDAGVCLDHHDRDATLESLPAIVREGISRDVLVVLRRFQV